MKRELREKALLVGNSMTHEKNTPTKRDLQLSKGSVVAMGATRPKFMTEKEAANYLSVKPQTLCAWRCTRRYNLRFVKVGRLVRYREEDLEAFLESRTVGAVQED